MKLPTPLADATLLRRYKRFLADVRLPDGREMTVHCANPGSMTGLAVPGRRCRISDSQNPKRKLRWSLELIEVDGAWVGVHTGRTNAIVAEALAAGAVREVGVPARIDAEVRLEKSRIDFRVRSEVGEERWLEVKQVTLASPPLCRFPDSPTERGRKHVAELARQSRAGHAATLLMVATRADCDRFEAAADIDPEYERALKSAVEAGVQVLAYRCRVTPDSIELDEPLEHPYR